MNKIKELTMHQKIVCLAWIAEVLREEKFADHNYFLCHQFGKWCDRTYSLPVISQKTHPEFTSTERNYQGLSLRFPELWSEIRRVVERTRWKNASAIHYSDNYAIRGRIRLLARVEKMI